MLAADTTVVVDAEILGKPESEAQAHDDARQAVRPRARGAHRRRADRERHVTQVALSSTRVTFAALSREQIHAYWQSGEPQGKAGAYAIQGLGAVFVAGIAGSYTGVMGLPLFETAQLLRAAGIPVWNGAVS